MDTASQATPEPRRRLGGRLTEPFIRALLALLAVVLVWAGNRQLFIWMLNQKATWQMSVPGWLAWVGLLVLAGFVLGLAAGPRRTWRYRFSTAFAVGIIPFLMLVHVSLYWFVVLQHKVQVPLISKGWFMDHTAWYTLHWEVELAVAMMLGVAISAGFRAREPVTAERQPHG